VFAKYPFFDSRQIATDLPRNGFHAGRHRVRSLNRIIEWRGHVNMPCSAKGKPQKNAYIERYNRTVRQEWLAQISLKR
jgi:putative transposase